MSPADPTADVAARPTGPAAVAEAFAAAWNAADADALADLFAEDADFVNVVGVWWRRRRQIRVNHALGFRWMFPASRLVLGQVRVRELGDVAVVHAPWTMTGQTAPDGDEAGEMMQNLPAEEGARQLAGAVDWLLARDEVTSQTVGAIGFCMGGGFVLALAAQQGDKVSAAVPFYGVGQGVPGDFSGVTAAVQGHYAEQDDSFPVEDARRQEQQIREESGADVEYFYYDAPHAFHNDENPQGNHRPEAAALAWDRAVSFLKEKVR